MRSCRPVCAAVSLAATVILSVASPVALAKATGDAAEIPALSSYWDHAIRRWEPIIQQEADRRQLDADLVAAVIWQESRGRETARGPAGAVGLMMVMPFEWRPTADKLENPWTNLFWGSRALAHTTRDGRGDLFYSLAAYNGSWENIDRPSTRGYATRVLDYYTRAVAVRSGLNADGDWIALIAPVGLPGPRTITVLGPNVPLTRFTERPWRAPGIPQVPDGAPAQATAITFVDESGAECRVNVWLLTEHHCGVAESEAASTTTFAAISTTGQPIVVTQPASAPRVEHRGH